MEHLRRRGVAEQVRQAAPLPVAWSQRVTFCDALSGHRITDFDGVPELVTDRDERFAEAGHQVAQPVPEQVLRDHLTRQECVETRFGHIVPRVLQHPDRVMVDLRNGEGHEYRVFANYALGCDGPGSAVREQIRAVYEGRSDPRPNFDVIFRAPGPDTDLGPAVRYRVVGARTTGVLGRLDLSGTWWASFPGLDAAYGTRNTARLIADLVGEPADHELPACDPWTARMLIADRFQDGRVLLVGESAHVNPPWGGHGCDTCVGDAANIAWKTAAVTDAWQAIPPRLVDRLHIRRPRGSCTAPKAPTTPPCSKPPNPPARRSRSTSCTRSSKAGPATSPVSRPP